MRSNPSGTHGAGRGGVSDRDFVIDPAKALALVRLRPGDRRSRARRSLPLLRGARDARPPSAWSGRLHAWAKAGQATNQSCTSR